MPLTIRTVLPFDGAGFNGYGCGCGCGMGPCGCASACPCQITTQGLGQAETGGATAPPAPGGDTAPKPSASWTGQQWSLFFQGLGAITKPLLTATGALIDLRSGRVIAPAGSDTAQLYAAFMAKQQQQQQTPTWMMPALILGGAAVLAFVIARR
jgi:hypothetical protein